jgi:beta-ketoacyl-acyl-carrier-protein synthase II
LEKKVVVTGMGVIAPNGIGKDEFWRNTVKGQPAITSISAFDPSGFKSRIAGEVKNFDPRNMGLREEQIRRLDRYAQFAMVAAKMAVADAELEMEKLDKNRAGVCIANAICGTKFMEEEFLVVTENGKEAINPEWPHPGLYPSSTFNTASAEVASYYGINGLCCTLVTGCTAGLDAVGFAVERIKDGDVDVMIVGSSEAPLTPIAMAAFDVIGALSTYNQEPSKASRPFDKTRNGFVLSEGCGIFILEEREHAVARGAHILAEVSGFGSCCNAFHMTDLAADGKDLARAITLALGDASLRPDQIDYINAHGSSTVQNDRNETSAYKIIFNSHASDIPVSSLKSMIGHPLAAANCIELAATVMTLQQGIIPPTINYEFPDPDCALNCVPNTAIERPVQFALKTASGFAGIHSALVMGRC